MLSNLKRLFPHVAAISDLCLRKKKGNDMPSKEYYRKLKKEAHDLYVNECLSNREIAERINVSEKSVSSWTNGNDGLWKKERQAAIVNSKKQGDNLREIIAILADQKLQLLHDIDEAGAQGDTGRVLELRKQAASLDNSVAQWGKQLAELDKQNRITLSVYLEVMDRIFESLKAFDAELYYRSLDFQESHIYETSKILG